MNLSLWAALLIIAIGTFLMRALPMLWMKRRLSRHRNKEVSQSIPSWITVLGPVMIAAMFGVSLVPSSVSTESWIATLIGVVVTMLVWLKTRTLGLPVFFGVLLYGVVLYILVI